MVLQHDRMLATLSKNAELMANTESERQNLEAKLLKLCDGASTDTGARIGSVRADAEQLKTVTASLATLEQQVELMVKVWRPSQSPIPPQHLAELPIMPIKPFCEMALGNHGGLGLVICDPNRQPHGNGPTPIPHRPPRCLQAEIERQDLKANLLKLCSATAPAPYASCTHGHISNFCSALA